VLVEKKKALLISVAIIALTTTLIVWLVHEPSSQPNRVILQCTGVDTNSTEAYATYVISNRNEYAISIDLYLYGKPTVGGNFQGMSPPEIILPAASHTNITMPKYKNVAPQDEFIVLYRSYGFKTRLAKYAYAHNLNRWLPKQLTQLSPDTEKHCSRCPE
jgi:hypothetical protein